MKTIVMVTDDYLPAKTGVGIHVQKISAQLIQMGHRVIVVTCRKKGQPAVELIDGVRIHRLPSISIVGYPQVMATRRRLQAIFMEEKANVVHCHYLSLMMWNAIAAARDMGLPTLYTAHMSVDLLVSPVFMKPFLPLFTGLYFSMLEKVDMVLCPSQVQARQVNQFTVHPKVIRLPNPIEFSGVEAADAVDPKRFIVLFVGRLSPEKNLGYLIESFAQVSAAVPGAECWIAGSGVMEAEIRRRVKEKGLEGKVVFKGQVAHEQLPQLYTSADVFFLPSLREVLALVALEAMRFARPVLVTDRIICADELVEHGKTGWIVNADDPGDAAARLIAMARERQMCREMGQQGFERSLAYTLDAVITTLEECYDAADGQRAALKSAVDAPRRYTCVCCQHGTFDESKDTGVLASDDRNMRDEYFRMWRCPVCHCLHSLVYTHWKDLNRLSPFRNRRLNIFNRQMFNGFYDFLKENGLKPADKVLFYGLSGGLFKEVFSAQGQENIDVVDHALSPQELKSQPQGNYDAVIVMEHLECAEDPREVFKFVSGQLRPGGLLIVHTPDARMIKLDSQALWRLHQPYRIHILSELMLQMMGCAQGFIFKFSRRRNYMDTQWPFINFHAFHELPFFGDMTLDAALEFKPSHLLRAWWRLPRFIFWGLMGGIFRDRSNVIVGFQKPAAVLPSA